MRVITNRIVPVHGRAHSQKLTTVGEGNTEPEAALGKAGIGGHWRQDG